MEAVRGDSALFDISLHNGRGGVGSFQPRELDESCGDPLHGVWDRARFLLQLRCLLYALLAFGVGGFLSHLQALSGPEALTQPRSSSL